MSGDGDAPSLDGRGRDELGGGPPGAGERPPERVAPKAELDQVLRRAHGFGDEGDFEGMAATLQEALESWPEDPYILCWLAVAEREMGLGGIAYEHFKACLAQEPQDAHLLATAGTALAEVDDPEAEPALRSAALLAPDLPLARWMYGAWLTREGMVEEGLKELDVAVELDPEDAVIHYERGVALALSERLSEAVDALFQATELDPDDGWVRVVLGLLLVEDDRVEEAAGELERGARDRPADVEAQVLAALAVSAAGYEDRAWELLERGRLDAAGADAAFVVAAEERLEEGPEPSADFLEELLPGALRERLMTRP